MGGSSSGVRSRFESRSDDRGDPYGARSGSDANREAGGRVRPTGRELVRSTTVHAASSLHEPEPNALGSVTCPGHHPGNRPHTSQRLRPYCSWLDTQSSDEMAEASEISPARTTPAMISASLLTLPRP